MAEHSDLLPRASRMCAKNMNQKTLVLPTSRLVENRRSILAHPADRCEGSLGNIDLLLPLRTR